MPQRILSNRKRRSLQLESLECRLLLAMVISDWTSVATPGSGGRIDALSVQPGNSDSVLVSGDMLSVGFSRDGGLSWDGDYRGIENYQASDFTWDPVQPDRVWMGTLGGPHVSDDAGETWTLARDGMPARLNGQVTAPIEKVLYDPNDPEGDRLLAFEGDHRIFGSGVGFYDGVVWISENGGDDWTSQISIVPGGNITDAEYLGNSGTRIMATVLGSGIYASDDDGLTWEPKNNGLPSLETRSITAHPTDDLTAWATVADSGVYFTDDGGDTWTARNTGLTITNRANFLSIDLAEVTPNGVVLYASNAPGGGNGEGVYKSTDGGLQWSHSLFNQSQIVNGDVFAEGVSAWWVEVDVNDPETVWVGSSARVVRTTDGGVTWVDMLNDASPQVGFFTGRGFQGWVSSNYEINPFDSQHHIAQAWDSGKVMQSFDGGQTWSRSLAEAADPISPFGGGQDVAYATADLIYAAVGQSSDTRPDILRSGDAGGSWLTLPYPQGLDRTPEALHFNAANPSELWFTTDVGLFQSLNADAADHTTVSWQQVDTSFATKLYRIDSDPFDPAAFYLSTDTGVYHRDNAGVFNLLAGSPINVNGGGDMKLTADPHSSGRVYLANFSTFSNAQRGLWRYDSSSGWTRLFDDNWVRDFDVDPLDPNRLVLSTDKAPYGDTIQATGVYISHDGGESWESHNDGLPMIRAQHVSFAPSGNALYTGLTGRGFYRADLSRTPACDFDGSGACDVTDLDALQANLVSGPADPNLFDLTGDGQVTIADRDEWLVQAGAENLPSGNAYLLGDANLDGSVDGQDFLAWNDNKFTTSSYWSDGDFNADGVIDGQDFVAWNDNKFTAADLGVLALRHDLSEDDDSESRSLRRDKLDSVCRTQHQGMVTRLPKVARILQNLRYFS